MEVSWKNLPICIDFVFLLAFLAIHILLNFLVDCAKSDAAGSQLKLAHCRSVITTCPTPITQILQHYEISADNLHNCCDSHKAVHFLQTHSLIDALEVLQISQRTAANKKGTVASVVCNNWWWKLHALDQLEVFGLIA